MAAKLDHLQLRALLALVRGEGPLTPWPKAKIESARPLLESMLAELEARHVMPTEDDLHGRRGPRKTKS
jgi:hypothetical protein